MTCDGVHCGIVSWGIGCGGLFHPGKNLRLLDFILLKTL
jgi:hypothetical protein